MDSNKRVDESSIDMTSTSKDTIDPDLMAKSYLAFKKFHPNSYSHSKSTSTSRICNPTENSLAWFMLRYGPLIPRPDLRPLDSNSTSDDSTPASRSTALLPAGVVPLDFDLESDVYDFAMNYENILCTPQGYRGLIRPMIASKEPLHMFLHNHLWADVNTALNSAPDLPYYIDGTKSTGGEDVSIRKVIANSDDIFHPKVAILQLKTPSSLNILHFRALCSQQPSSADNHNKEILYQVYRYFKSAQVTWGAISNGLSTVFVRYEPNTMVFAMSDIIPHEHPAIIGYYCYWARLSDLQRIDHPRRSLFFRPLRKMTLEGNGDSRSRMLTRPLTETQKDGNANNCTVPLGQI